MTTRENKKANPNRAGFYTWTVEIQVHETWVEDGFDLNKDNVHERICGLIPYAYGNEVKARILTKPPRSAIRKAQGG